MPTCPICLGNFQTTKAGLIRSHGPRSNPCKGSGAAPINKTVATNSNPKEESNGSESLAPTAEIDPKLIFNAQTTTIRWIPHNLITLAAESFTDALKHVSDNPHEKQSWINLMKWPKTRLSVPSTSNKLSRKERNKALREQLTAKTSPQTQTTQVLHHKTKETTDEQLERRVRQRIDAGDVRGAMRLVVNEGKVIEPDDKSAEALRKKHPIGAIIDEDPSTEDVSIEPTDEQIRAAIEGMSTGGAPGPDGLRPSHLKQMTRSKAGLSKDKLFSEIKRFSIICIKGLIPRTARSSFFGANLIALKKKDGGLRPIAIGLVLRRLVSRSVCISSREKAKNLLSPFQLGVGIAGGAEAATHATRRFLSQKNDALGIVKLDFANAFNCVTRKQIIESVGLFLPELRNYVVAAYATPSALLFGSQVIMSACGVQQGDPIGPLLFAISIRHITHSSTAPFVVWYLDDATLGGTAEEVCRELARARAAASAIGLELNTQKCEAVSDSASFADKVRALLPDCKTILPEHCELLGAPLSPKAADQCLTRKAAILETITPRLARLGRHDAHALLRCSLGHPRVT